MFVLTCLITVCIFSFGMEGYSQSFMCPNGTGWARDYWAYDMYGQCNQYYTCDFESGNYCIPQCSYPAALICAFVYEGIYHPVPDCYCEIEGCNQTQINTCIMLGREIDRNSCKCVECRWDLQMQCAFDEGYLNPWDCSCVFEDLCVALIHTMMQCPTGWYCSMNDLCFSTGCIWAIGNPDVCGDRVFQLYPGGSTTCIYRGCN